MYEKTYDNSLHLTTNNLSSYSHPCFNPSKYTPEEHTFIHPQPNYHHVPTPSPKNSKIQKPQIPTIGQTWSIDNMAKYALYWPSLSYLDPNTQNSTPKLDKLMTGTPKYIHNVTQQTSMLSWNTQSPRSIHVAYTSRFSHPNAHNLTPKLAIIRMVSPSTHTTPHQNVCPLTCNPKVNMAPNIVPILQLHVANDPPLAPWKSYYNP